MSMDETNGAAPTIALDHLTPRQRMVYRMIHAFANDLDRGTTAEQHTAALLRLAADAIEHGYEAELVALVRAWWLDRRRVGGG